MIVLGTANQDRVIANDLASPSLTCEVGLPTLILA
jgi:hypothetical protein